MSFRKRLRKSLHKAGRYGLAVGTLGGSEIIKHRKQIGAAIKRNPELVGAGVGLAFGAPFIGAGIGSQFGSFLKKPPSPEELGSTLAGYDMPLEGESAVAETPAPESSGFAPGFDKKWLIIGAVAIVAVVLLMKSSTTK